jgi:sialidase-1
MAGIVRYRYGGHSFILFSNPHNLEGGRESTPSPGKSRARRNVSIKLSRDEAQTWPVNKVLEDGPSSYSDLAVTPSGTILCFYGAGSKLSFAGSALRLARFNLEWLQQP